MAARAVAAVTGKMRHSRRLALTGLAPTVTAIAAAVTTGGCLRVVLQQRLPAAAAAVEARSTDKVNWPHHDVVWKITCKQLCRTGMHDSLLMGGDGSVKH
jgi:hypothetical protein